MPRDDIRIEFPSAGATYSEQEYGVYQYDTHPRSSVLAGLERRTFLDSFPTEAEAVKNYPQATLVRGSGYAPVALDHLSDDNDDGDA